SLPAASMSMLGSGNPEGGAFDIELEPDRLKTIKVFVRQAAGQAASPLQEFKFIIEDSAGGERADYTATFNAPETAQ
ncbi:MAG: FixG Ig-like domain-containing protein, partial [Rhizobium giardinii]